MRRIRAARSSDWAVAVTGQRRTIKTAINPHRCAALSWMVRITMLLPWLPLLAMARGCGSFMATYRAVLVSVAARADIVQTGSMRASRWTCRGTPSERVAKQRARLGQLILARG